MSLSLILPDVHNRLIFDPTSPIDWARSSVPTLSLLLAIRLAFKQPTSGPLRVFRYALCPLGILATVLFCASYDVSCGNPMYNSFNYGVGLGGFTIAMKHAELVFLDQRPKRVDVRAAEKKKTDDEKPLSNGNGVQNGQNGHLGPVTNGWHGGESEPDVTWTEVFWYLCDPRGITYDFGATAFKAPEWRDVNNRTSFLLSTVWQVARLLIMLDIFQTLMQSIPGTTAGTPQGGSIYIDGVSTPLRYLISTLMSLSMGSAIYCGMDMMHDVFTLASVGLFGQDPAEHPPLFWEPMKGTSLHQLWGRRWHPLFRQEFTALGWKVGRAVMGQLGGLLGVFMLSGLLHDVGIWGMGKGTDPWRIIGFFYLQGVGIALEGMWKKTTGRNVEGVWGRIWTWTWMIVTSHLVVEAWLQKGIVGNTVVLPDRFRPILRLRDYIVPYIIMLSK